LEGDRRRRPLCVAPPAIDTHLPPITRSGRLQGALHRTDTLIAKVFQADPLTCGKCGGKLKIVVYLHDQVAIKQVLAHLGLSPPEEPKPPPALHEVVRVPLDEEGRQIEAP